MPRLPSIQSRLVELAPGYIRTPFVILVDTAEKHPWTFDGGFRSRSFVDKEQRRYGPQIDRRHLGVGRGDYSLDGFQDRCGIERKSLQDFQGTLLGWERQIDEDANLVEWDTRNSVDRRARFKRELATLAAMDCKAVIVEATMGEILSNAPEWGVRTASENAKYLHSTLIAWQQEFPGVPWLFCDTRELAEATAFRLLEQWWAREQRHLRQRRRGEADQMVLAGMEE